MPNAAQEDHAPLNRLKRAMMSALSPESGKLVANPEKPWLPVLVVLVPALAGFLGIMGAVLALLLASHGKG